MYRQLRAGAEVDMSGAVITDKLGKLPLQLALESRPRDAGVLQLLAGVCPHGRELMVAFFMEQLNMDANDVVRLAQRLQQEHQRRLSKVG